MKKAVWTFEDLLFPYIGARPVSALTAPELLGVFRRLERRGKHETAHRAKQRVGQVFVTRSRAGVLSVTPPLTFAAPWPL